MSSRPKAKRGSLARSALLSVLSACCWAHGSIAAPPVDALSPWASGPQLIFHQPAQVRSLSDGLSLSYDISARLKDNEQSAQLLAISAALGERLTLGLAALSDPGPSPLSALGASGPVKALALNQSLRLGLGLNIGATVSRLWREGSSSDLNERWRLSLGLSYEPSSWLRLGLSLPRLKARGQLMERQEALSSQVTPISLALRPFERLGLGLGLSPLEGGGLWSASLSLRLWRGLGLEARYVEAYGSDLKPSAPLSAALAWRGDWGWRAELSSSDQRFTELGATASVRLSEAPPERSLELNGRRMLLISHQGEDEVKREAALLGAGRVSAPLLNTLRALSAAQRDPSVERVTLLLNSGSLGWAQAEELAVALKRLREAGKEITLFSPSLSPTSYIVAAEASELWLRPTSEVKLSGLLTERFYLKRLLDQLNVQAEFIAVGDYKSAPEMFLREGPSEEASVAQRAALDGRYARLLSALERRCLSHKSGCSPERARAQAELWLKEGPYNAREARERGLVDRIVHAVELDRAIGQAYPSLSLSPAEPSPQERPWGAPDALAILYLVGDIGAASPLGGGEVSAAAFAPLIRELEARDEVKGVLLRVDSPGGAISDADEIWQSLKRLAQRKPLVVSMGNIAASGGYYVAAPARRIYASPNTLTGSIGVFAGKANLAPALERIGVNIHRSRRGEGGGETSLFTPWTEAQRGQIKRSMEGLYELFLERVSEGRPQLTRARLLPLAGGRVWTGAQALERGLVDQLGGTLDALEGLEELTGLSEGAYRLELVTPSAPSLLKQLGGLTVAHGQTQPTSAELSLLSAQLPPLLRGLIKLLINHPSEGVAYLSDW